MREGVRDMRQEKKARYMRQNTGDRRQGAGEHETGGRKDEA